MRRCPECRGFGIIDCPVCRGTGRDPRNEDIDCTYCRGTGRDPRNEDIDCTYCRGTTTIKCNICGGTGWLDDDDDYRA